MKVPVVDDVLYPQVQKIYPTKYLGENSIEFQFQTDRNVYVDLRQTYFAVKYKLLKRRGFDFLQNNRKIGAPRIRCFY